MSGTILEVKYALSTLETNSHLHFISGHIVQYLIIKDSTNTGGKNVPWQWAFLINLD